MPYLKPVLTVAEMAKYKAMFLDARINKAKAFLKSINHWFPKESDLRPDYLNLANLVHDHHKAKVFTELNNESFVKVLNEAKFKGIISDSAKEHIVSAYQNAMMENNAKAENQLTKSKK